MASFCYLPKNWLLLSPLKVNIMKRIYLSLLCGFLSIATQAAEDIDISQPEPGEAKNSWGIITSPGQGQEQTYTRQGMAYRAENNKAQQVDQEGVLHLVTCESGTVYMQQPISYYTSAYAATAWIKGKRVDSRLVFPPSQPINYSYYYEATMSVCLTRSYDMRHQTYTPDRNRNIEFEVSPDGKTLTLLDTKSSAPLGAFYDDDDAWTGYGDFSTVLTFMGDGHEEEIVQPDPRLPVSSYQLMAYDMEVGAVSYDAKLVRDGETVYLGSFCFYADGLWIKGNVEGNDLVFPREQYLQSLYDYDLFFYAAIEQYGGLSLRDLRLSWDEAQHCYFTDQHLLVTWGKVAGSLGRAEDLKDILLIPNEEESIERVVPETARPQGRYDLLGRPAAGERGMWIIRR